MYNSLHPSDFAAIGTGTSGKLTVSHSGDAAFPAFPVPDKIQENRYRDTLWDVQGGSGSLFLGSSLHCRHRAFLEQIDILLGSLVTERGAGSEPEKKRKTANR